MGGRRFGVPSHGMGRGRGGFMYHPRIQNVGVSSPRGRGQGRGRGRGSKGSGRKLEIHVPSDSSAAEAQPGMACEPLHIQDVVQVTTATISWEPVLPAWCDICRVRCNIKEILEQHKNGKRHKRTVQVMQDMAGLQDLIPSIPDLANPVSQVAKLPLTSWQLVGGPSTAVHRSPPVSSSCLGGGEHNDLAPENVIAAVAGVQVTEATTGNSAQQNTVPPTKTVGHSVGAQIEAHQPVNEMKDAGEVPPYNATGPSNMQSLEARMDGIGGRYCPKRKMKGSGCGEKKPRASEEQGHRPKRVREQPLVCTLCNATCNARAIFDAHLVGKKHRSRLNRLQGADTVFGPLGVYTPNQPVTHRKSS